MSAPVPCCAECGAPVEAFDVVVDGLHRECAKAAEDYRRATATCQSPPLKYFTGREIEFLVFAHPGAARRCGFRVVA